MSRDPVTTAAPFGPFVLERRIAVGGAAEVFLARPKLGSRPAPELVVKRLLPSPTGEHDFAALEREATLHQAVHHPHVVEMYGAGMVADEPYLAMEYVEGVDLHRLLRRAESEQRKLPIGLATYIARRIARALAAVHAARASDGTPLGIVHRDVTPTNVYLSVRGEVKIGDFGIARVAESAGAPLSGRGIKGKYGYLSPEQVAGERFDRRADLFSTAVVYGEMIAGERVFPGSGQLAVLLAIRDGNPEVLRRRYTSLPRGLPEVLERAFARDPADRFQSGNDLDAALEPFEGSDDWAAELASWVEWARDSSRLAQRIEGRVRDSVQRMQAVRRSSSGSMPAVSAAAASERSHVRRRDGSRMDDLEFARLVELIATGELSGDDEVSLMGAEFTPIRDLAELARHLLPTTTATTGRMFEPGAPDFRAELSETQMLEVLARMRRGAETGLLLVETRSDDSVKRREVYLSKGRLHHVATTDRDELLGEYLVRRGVLARPALEGALRAIGTQGGRLGDTLIGLGLVDAMDIFRAIRELGRDRVARTAGWREGSAVFYRGAPAPRVDFPLDLDLGGIMMAGALVVASGVPRALLPPDEGIVAPGARAYVAVDRAEQGTSPQSLVAVAEIAQHQLTIAQALAAIRVPTPEGRVPSETEACVALVVAEKLAWIRFA